VALGLAARSITTLDWAAGKATKVGYAGVTVACADRPPVARPGAARGGARMRFVCVQPLMSSWARRGEDLTFDKTDDKDAVLIARLTAELRCYLPEPVEETWGRLRHVGARRERLVSELTAQVQQIRDLLECVWPAMLATAAQPFKSRTWAAALSVVVHRDGGDLSRTRRLGRPRFETQVRREAARWGASTQCLRIARLVFAALDDRAEVLATGAAPRNGSRSCSPTGVRPMAASPPPGRWSSTPAWRPAEGLRCLHRPHRDDRAVPDPACGWPPGV
jgi:transposase